MTFEIAIFIVTFVLILVALCIAYLINAYKWTSETEEKCEAIREWCEEEMRKINECRKDE